MVLSHVWFLGSVWALCQVMPVGRRGGTRRRQREGEAERKNASGEGVECVCVCGGGLLAPI